eukprot:NODE_6218_length_645_cov_3.629195_g5289_i0.p1 GENE.NODE_6218_length_645_cov_3.629195_g5289_i0~~NODE_6218_length_645_cov_3.629195_g5289_i0.p1  ORF type:complete len:88 (-),score=6.14 NODE_6218_length_645_cov_3.629195_g5289_i0:284-547(-)
MQRLGSMQQMREGGRLSDELPVPCSAWVPGPCLSTLPRTQSAMLGAPGATPAEAATAWLQALPQHVQNFLFEVDDVSCAFLYPRVGR